MAKHDWFEHTLKVPKIIAEIGSTWKAENGKEDIDNCLTCCNMAAEYGATAVKFQMFTHKELYGIDGDDKYALPRDFIPKLKDYCDDLGIEFMCSAFSVEGYKFLMPYVETHKIASSCVGNQNLIDYASTSKDVTWLVSDGMFDVPVWRNWVPMVCASVYPAIIQDYDLSEIYRYNVYGPWGLSDHTTRYDLARMLRANGCSYFEKHVDFLISRHDNPDFHHSILPEQFGRYTDAIRKMEVGRPKKLKLEAREKWGDRWDNEVMGYFRPKA